MHTVPLLLASASPRRLALLEQIGCKPQWVEPVDIDETVQKGELPKPHAERLAYEKALAAQQKHPDTYILAADTVVGCGRRILPKAETDMQVAECLRLLSGRRHHVYTAIVLVEDKGAFLRRCVTTMVQFKRLSDEDMAEYVASGEGLGKAGGYAIQGKAEALVKRIDGSFSGVVGLPLYETRNMLSGKIG